MAKDVKFRVGISKSEYFVVDVNAENEEGAIEKSFFEVGMFPDDYITGISRSVTSVLINDKESKGFAPYVEEFISKNNEDMKDFI